MRLPAAPDAVAPDGSAVRVLLRLAGGSMAHFQLAAVTMPPWPGDDEAYQVSGAWPAGSRPAPG
jgi:hypothetical protein